MCEHVLCAAGSVGRFGRIGVQPPHMPAMTERALLDPKLDSVSTRLFVESPDALVALRATGKGWHTRLDVLLHEAVQVGRV